jgi:hypothetical protein
MTTTQDPAVSRKVDNAKARLASRASYARRRHAVWIAELRECGVTVLIPPEYNGLPIEVPPDQGVTT